MADNGNIFPWVRQIVIMVIALGALLLFVLLYGNAILLAWSPPPEGSTAPLFDENYVNLANIIAGLVGGIVAAALGQPAPSAPPAPTSVGARLAVGVNNLGKIAIPWNWFRQGVGSVYALVYVLFGFAAIITSFARPDTISDLLKGFATIVIGLFVGVITSLFSAGS